ncbi:MAG: class A beta-lactamase-related serine hydrolase [Planctomycetota bacterium]|nr:MAG: class A beta-lactamase-related serine hydrolase [Planctomycetota bacterium]
MILFSLALLFLQVPSEGHFSPQSGGRGGPSFQWELDRLVQRNQGYGGGVYRVSHGSHGLIWEGASGELLRGGAPMRADSVFEIASTTKAMTAAAVLLLMEDGLLDMDAPIDTYLPAAYTQDLLVIQGHNYGPELTLRQLLSHTAGLPDYWSDPPFVFPGQNAFLVDYYLRPGKFWTPEEVLSYVPDLDPKFVPGTGWHYSDTGFVLAGLIAERVSGQSLHKVFRHKIFLPLGMNDTWLHWREPQPPGQSTSHRYESQWNMFPKRHNSADWAGGGLVSSTRDLEAFIRALADETLFTQPSTSGQMQAWVPTGMGQIEYGLGLFQVPLGFGLGKIWGHDGYGNSWMYFWPDQDVSFVGTLNQASNDWWPLVLATAWQLQP